ncbi:hypothetical protein BDZ94DRAFT_1263335 [Collybia nuda]|uniref:Uncharacterized protein n=1 Tax=Collybia nuda TaxID=64659 RepID=A0A9P5Y1P8_9AGAR|nr:hypothetical protein BDZ94DRAFT_1263335 [Collybia nuda]
MLSVILNHSTQLTTCRVMVTEPRSIRDNRDYPIILEHLQTLDVMQEQCSGVDGFLARLVVPKLKDFRTGCLQDWPQSGIMKMLEQSNCPLKTFETTYHVPPTVLPVLMCAMPEVTTLKIYPIHPISRSILNEIRERNLCPKLRRLRGWEILSLRPFVDLLQSRWESPEEGICDAIVRIRYKNFAPDEEYFRGFLPELTKNNRLILLNAY